jgi:hypothetical protein
MGIPKPEHALTDAARPLPIRSAPRRPRPGRFALVAVAALILFALVAWLHLMGRSFVCPCGEVRIWQSRLVPEENSQQFADWYSALHVVFGIALCGFVRRMRPRWTLLQSFVTVVAGSAVWEAVENVPMVIALFHEPSDALTYSGDSILNSLADTAFVLGGAVLAVRLPVWATCLMALLLELGVTLAINDGLVLGTLRILGAPV